LVFNLESLNCLLWFCNTFSIYSIINSVSRHYITRLPTPSASTSFFLLETALIFYCVYTREDLYPWRFKMGRSIGASFEIVTGNLVEEFNGVNNQ
jgi:hypothetical protein